MLEAQGSSRALLSRRDWVYLLSLLIPFVLYDLSLKAALIASQSEDFGFVEGLGLMRSDIFFNLGYVLLWIGLFAVARKGLSRWIVVGLFHVLTVSIALLATSAYWYFKVTGSTLDSGFILHYASSPEGTGGVIASEVTRDLLALVLIILAYGILGSPLVTRLVDRWRGWPGAGARTGRISWLRLAGVGLASYALFSFSLLPGGSERASKSFSRDAFVNMIMTAAEVTTVEVTEDGEEPQDIAVDPAAENPPPEASLFTGPSSERRNVVLVFLESARAGATTPYNKNLETTPFMNELAKSSILAERAYTIVPHSNNAITATNCGIDPPTDRWGTLSLAVRKPSTCLADLLKGQGYNTVYFTSSTQTFENLGRIVENLGYEEFYSVEDMDKEGFEQANYFGYEDDVMLKPSEEWLEKQKKSGKPFLATYATITAHHDYLAPQKRYGREDFNEDDLVNRYLNSIRYQDLFLKNLIDQYKKLGLYDDTVFVVLGDHGEGFGEHDRFQHDNVPYEEGLRIPLLIHDPRWCENGCESGGRIQTPVNQLDILPTVADLLGYGIKGGDFKGSSLLRPLPENRTFRASCWNEKGCVASIKGKEKYIYHYGDQPEEIFDLSEDPFERQNLAGQYSPEELEERRSELLEWRAKVNSRYGLVTSNNDAS